jgi:hypothetical protein
MIIDGFGDWGLRRIEEGDPIVNHPILINRQYLTNPQSSITT